MQEHIRRAHPEHYISKLPATEVSSRTPLASSPLTQPPQESFQLMVATPPQARPDPPPPSGPISGPGPLPLPTAPATQTPVYDYRRETNNHFFETDFARDPRPSNDGVRRGSLIPAATAAAALASLHNHRAEFDWDSDPVRCCPAVYPALRMLTHDRGE